MPEALRILRTPALVRPGEFRRHPSSSASRLPSPRAVGPGRPEDDVKGLVDRALEHRSAPRDPQPMALLGLVDPRVDWSGAGKTITRSPLLESAL